MKALLIATAVIEAIAGLALTTWPSAPVALLLGSSLDAPARRVGRLARAPGLTGSCARFVDLRPAGAPLPRPQHGNSIEPGENLEHHLAADEQFAERYAGLGSIKSFRFVQRLGGGCIIILKRRCRLDETIGVTINSQRNHDVAGASAKSDPSDDAGLVIGAQTDPAGGIGLHHR